MRLVRAWRPRSAYRLAALLCAIGAVAVASSIPVAEGRTIAPRLRGVQSFAFAIGDGAAGRNLSRYDLVIVDGVDTSARRVAQLKRGGAIVLAYVSVGTVESGRPWTSAASPYKMELWEDWQEWYADVSEPGFRRLVTGTIAPSMLRKGFDGLFLDNVDMIETHPAQAAGMRALVASLAAVVHRRRGLLFAQNGDDVIGSFVRYLDGWNREDVSGTYDFESGMYVAQSAADVSAAQETLRRVRRAGVFVTATDYVAAGDRAGAARALRNACAVRAVSFVSDIGLTRVAAVPGKCG